MNPLYMEDSYIKSFNAKVESVKDGKHVVLDNTAFYPDSGGQPNDTGVIMRDMDVFPVVFVGKSGGNISHEVSKAGLSAGDNVACVVDWDRRYRLMRSHTAAHVISGVIHDECGAKITGNQLGTDRSRIDFNVEKFERDMLSAYEAKANDVIGKFLAVHIREMPRDEAFRIPSISKLKMHLPESIKSVRVVDIEGFDMQACGGTHVKNTSEIGRVKIVKSENRGKESKRLYFEVVDV